jgi:ketosteroid isomerase-like protein
MTKSAVATAFSRGAFDQIYDHLSEDARWEVLGENTFENKQAIIKQCTEVAAYFKSVTTHFEVHQVIEEKNKIVVTGTAEFIRNGQRVSFVHGCDIYLFNEQGQIQSITSYCIQLK